MQETSVLQCGQGKDLLFLHGYGASKECFLPQINYFVHGYRVTAIDFPPFGNAPSLVSAWGVDDYVEYTLDILSRYDVKSPYVIAHSFGARVAVKASAGENCFEKMVLTGAAGINLNRGVAYKLKVFGYKAVRKISPAFANRHFGSEEYKKLSPMQKESYKKIVNEDLRQTAEKIKVPTLLVYGKEDKTTPVREGEEYCKRIVGSELCVMKDCGHFAFLDDVFTFNRITEEFLEKKL